MQLLHQEQWQFSCHQIWYFVYTYFYIDTGEKTTRAHPGSKFVVANTLAKWKKLEPNEIDFSQGLSQKVVSRSCSVLNPLPASDAFVVC